MSIPLSNPTLADQNRENLTGLSEGKGSGACHLPPPLTNNRRADTEEEVRGRRRQLVSALVVFVLLAGCRRSEPVPVDAPLAPAQRIDAPKFEGTYRAFKELEGALGVGVMEGQFLSLLQKIGAEVSILNDRVSTDAERNLAKRYGDALSEYQDSAYLWQKLTNWGMGRSGELQAILTLRGQIYDQRLAELVRKYGLASEPHRMPYSGVRWTAIPSSERQKIWSHAWEVSREANQIYLRSKELKE